MFSKIDPTIELRVRLSRDAGERLQRRAGESGKDVADYAAELIETAIDRQKLEEFIAPVRQEFEQSGMTEDELSELLETAKHRLRVARRAS